MGAATTRVETGRAGTGRGRTAERDATGNAAARIRAAAAVRGYVDRHEEAIRYLAEIRLVAALWRIRGRHRSEAEGPTVVRFSQRDDREATVEVSVGGRAVLRADFRHVEGEPRVADHVRVCRVWLFEDGAWLDVLLDEAGRAFEEDAAALAMRPAGERQGPRPAA